MTPRQLQRRPEGCLSDLTLEELIAGDLPLDGEGAAAGRHLEGCARCQQRRADLTAEPVLAPDPVTWQRQQQAAPAAAVPPDQLADRRARLRARVATALGAVGALAAAGVLTWEKTKAPPPDETRVKGAGVALSVHLRRTDGRQDRVDDQGRLAPGEEMRFAVTTTKAGYVVVLGLDAAGTVSVYSPGEAAGAAPERLSPPNATLLPGSIVADQTAGSERIVAVVCDTPPSLPLLRDKARAALQATGNHPESVASLDSGCPESSVLLWKK